MQDERFTRTAHLINLDFFNGDADVDAIAAALGGTTVRLTANAENLQTPGGQTTAITAAMTIAMMGIQIQPEIADVPLVGDQPPLTGGTILGALREYLGELGSLSDGSCPATLTIAIGSTTTDADAGIRLGASDWIGSAGRASSQMPTINAMLPFGPIAAAASGAADALRAAAPEIATAVGLPLASQWQWTVGLSVTVDLTPSGRPQGVATAAGPIDFVSGGAITNAALYTLLRVRGVCGSGRVIEPESLERSNLNRYFLCTPSDLGALKCAALRDHSSDSFPIVGIPVAYDAATAESVGALAPRVLVGVDDIPTRWRIQEQRPAWLCTGASSHLYAVVSVHAGGSPCARCVHARDDPGDGPIPTISFVSLLAGMLQARELVLVAAGYDRAGVATEVHPFGLSGPSAVREYRAGRLANCPSCGTAQTAA